MGGHGTPQKELITEVRFKGQWDSSTAGIADGLKGRRVEGWFHNQDYSHHGIGLVSIIGHLQNSHC